MCHVPARGDMRGLPGRALPGLAECIAANLQVALLTSPRVRMAGVALNTSALGEEEAKALCARIEDAPGLPCTGPYRMRTEERRVGDECGRKGSAWWSP